MDTIVSALLGVMDNLTASLLSFIAMIAIALGGSTILFTLFFADIMIGIGLALGPIALAFSVSGHMRGLLSNWLNFMFGAMITKVVAILIASIMLTAMSKLQITGAAASTAGAAFANTGAMIGIIFLGIIMTFIAKDADKIATGLFNGISTSRAPTGGDFMKAGRATGSTAVAGMQTGVNLGRAGGGAASQGLSGWKAQSGKMGPSQNTSFGAKAGAAMRGLASGAAPHLAKAGEATKKDFSKAK